jgi:drug/metabolite transporter (DMT)-like permease
MTVLPENRSPQTDSPDSSADHIFQPELPRRAPAIAAILLSSMLFAAMTVCTKALGQTLPAAQITLFRFVFGALVMLPLLRHPRAELLGHDRWSLVWRGVSGGLAVYLFFLSIHHTSLTHAVLLNYTSIIFAPLCSAITLRERLNGRAVGAILAAICGILCITRPEFGALRIGDLYGLLSGMMAGTAITTIRKLRRTETPWSIFFYFSLIGIPISLLFGLSHPMTWRLSPSVWSLLLGMACSSVAAQILLTYSYKYVRTSEGVLMSLSQIVYTAFAGAILFGEALTVSTLIGGALVLGSAIWLTITQRP